MEEVVIDVNGGINEMQNSLIEHIANVANKEHVFYFNSRDEFPDNDNWVHRIFCEDILTEIRPYYLSGQCHYTSSFGYRKNSSLPNDMRKFYYDIFRKHFPTGELTSALYR